MNETKRDERQAADSDAAPRAKPRDPTVKNSERSTMPASGPSDEELMLRYRDRADQDAFDQLVHRSERELYSYLYRYVGDAGLAEEDFQSTFFRLHQSRKLYQEGKRLRPWVYSIATHQAIDALRKLGRRPTPRLDRFERAGRGPDGGDVSLLDLLEAETPTPTVEAENAEHRAWVREAATIRIIAPIEGYDGRLFAHQEVLVLPFSEFSRYERAPRRQTRHVRWRDTG